jgi:parallel beta-helix repeat protein
MGGSDGHGLSVRAASNALVELVGCQLTENSSNGLAAQSGQLVIARRCVASNNGANGIEIAAGIGSIIESNSCTGGQIGISVGNWQTATQTGQDLSICNVTNNTISNSTIWAIAVSATGAAIQANFATLSGGNGLGGGILCRTSGGRVVGNRVDSGTVGIDVRTCYGSLIAGNQISNTGTGITAGAAQNVVISSNHLMQNTWGVVATAFEPSLALTPTGPVSLDRNWIGFTTAQGGGIRILDGAQGVSVSGNDIYGWGSASASQALWLHTDAAVVQGNRWNNTAQFPVAATVTAGQPALVLPDVADHVLVTSAPPTVSAVLTAHQVDTLGQIAFVRVVQGGAGYTQAQVNISGAGSGAAANAICDNGQVVGIVVVNPGSGYGAIGGSAVVSITGDGSGATAAAFVGLPVLAGRNLQIACSCPLRLSVGGSSPSQQNWTQFAMTVPAFGAVELVGVHGGWYAVQSPPVDYLSPIGDGGAILQSVAGGDVYLRPSLGGTLHIASESEPDGCTSNVGRGAPTGVVAAAPGSDFRNLNGGAGNTFWIKCTGTDSSGWVAVA